MISWQTTVDNPMGHTEMSNNTTIPTLAELKRRFGAIRDNVGYRIAWRRALPNAGAGTDEEQLLKDIESVDEDDFVNRYRNRLLANASAAKAVPDAEEKK